MREIMDTYAPALTRYAGRFVRDESAAQDVVQTAFIRLFRLDDARKPSPGSLKSWLYRVTHNAAVDHIRAEQRRKRLHEEHADVEKANRPDGNDSRMSDVLAKVHVLPEKEQQVLLLRLQEGLSYTEISEITGLKEGYVGYLLHNAVKKLSIAIRQSEQEENS